MTAINAPALRRLQTGDLFSTPMQHVQDLFSHRVGSTRPEARRNTTSLHQFPPDFRLPVPFSLRRPSRRSPSDAQRGEARPADAAILGGYNPLGQPASLLYRPGLSRITPGCFRKAARPQGSPPFRRSPVGEGLAACTATNPPGKAAFGGGRGRDRRKTWISGGAVAKAAAALAVGRPGGPPKICKCPALEAPFRDRDEMATNPWAGRDRSGVRAQTPPERRLRMQNDKGTLCGTDVCYGSPGEGAFVGVSCVRIDRLCTPSCGICIGANFLLILTNGFASFRADATGAG